MLLRSSIQGSGDHGNLEQFPFLETLVLDKNGLTSLAWLPPCPTLTTLWANNNALADAEALCDAVGAKFPALQMLSTMRNPCCPFLKADAGPDDYRRYRLRVLHRLPGLLSLDGSLLVQLALFFLLGVEHLLQALR